MGSITDLVSAVVLAGGRSSRMGRDKAGLVYGGETLLARSIRVLRALTDDVMVVGRVLDAPPRARMIEDDVPGLGPLGGLATGLRQSAYRYVICLGCDLPFVEPEVLRGLGQLMRDHDAVVPRISGRSQPFHAVYDRDVRSSIETYLSAGSRAVLPFLDALSVRYVDELELRQWDPELRSCVNVNTPEEWRVVLGSPPGRQSSSCRR